MRVALLLSVALLVGCVGDSGSPTDPAVAPSHVMRPSPSPISPQPAPGDIPGSRGALDPRVGQFGDCVGEGTVKFANAPMRNEDFRSMLPYGLVVGAHVTPIDHMYFEPADRSLGRDAYDVRAIADGVIYSIQPRDVNVDTGAARAREWRMDIAHTCTFTSYFDLLTSITPEVEAAYNASRMGPFHGFPIKAGQLVGHIGAQTLDFGVYDYNITLPGFVVPEHYASESWKVHTVDPFPYFEEATRDALLAKMMRTAEPRAGKIDHDIDGALVGSWFKTGTNGYRGIDQSSYWRGHLSIAPNTYDPSHIIFSVGDFNGRATQFGIKGGADPFTITPASGIQTWELVQYDARDNITGAPGFGPGGIEPSHGITVTNREQVLGTVLVQMTGARSLKLELFPGSTAAQVTGFGENAWNYER